MPLSQSWASFDLITAAIVFCVYVVVDGMYASYTLSVAEKKPMRSATIGALMHFLLAVGVLSYVQNYLYLAPLAAGSWLGTYLVVRRAEKSALPLHA